MEAGQSPENAGLPPGLYEQLVTGRVARTLESTSNRVRTGPLESDQAPLVLSAYLAEVAARALRAGGHGRDVARQIQLSNQVIDLIARAVDLGGELDDDLVERGEQLLAVMPSISGGLAQPAEPPRPLTPLAQDALLVHAPHEPALASELRREIASADRIELLCAFVVWSGVRVLLEELHRARARGVPIRVITTTYTGTTDKRSLDELAALGADVRVSYDTRATRLHAKAWLFERNSGFSTAYIGSSNLTHSALHEGLEWNVRLAQASSPGLLERFRAAFETYWADPQFEPYEPDRFTRELARQQSSDGVAFAPVDIRPYPFQEDMLLHLQVERERHHRWRNLLVAATGTGKTVVAAFDYQRLASHWGPTRLLFVAHRDEILRQSLSVFRTVMRDGQFGELLVGGSRPTVGDQVFASIQSLSRMDLTTIDPAYFDMVIVDEFHHAEAPTYQRLLNHVQPRVLLGLTATPERTDPTQDITHWFGGHVAYELRLWDALEQRLLCPFQYFGISDDVPLTDVAWRRGGYDPAALSRVYTGNDARAAKIISAVQRYVLDPRSIRALGFCVSVAHAEYMVRKFNEAGIPSVAITGQTSPVDRSAGLQNLRTGSVNVVFSVDVFNEGLDIPEVDTVLLLRPTESATVFLQQLGRGLRNVPGKSGLTVLDLIGQQRREFRFEPRFAALTRLPRAELLRTIEQGFPYLPSGCSIQLDRVAQQVVLTNIRATVRGGAAALVSELRLSGAVRLGDFLRASERTLDEVYRPSVGGWSRLQRLAGFDVAQGPDRDRLEKAIGRMLHVDDEERVALYTRVLAAKAAPVPGELSERNRRLLTMLHFDLWGRDGGHSDLAASMAALWRNPSIREELVQLLEVLGEQALSLGQASTLEPAIPLLVHQRYTRGEILAGLGESTVEQPREWREGVLYSRRNRADVFLVTLQKEPGRFSPSTMYRDYAISRDIFHWESQSTTSVTSPTGQRYIHHLQQGSRVLLFARETGERSGATLAYLFLGPARYVEHRGDRPIAITWRLDHALPPAFYQEARAVA